jgi:hypothetical protein
MTSCILYWPEQWAFEKLKRKWPKRCVELITVERENIEKKSLPPRHNEGEIQHGGE